ncbi:MAG TPA: CPBP family glutamic-type intramembrane protease [Phycisphaerae bacterium]|nr:CPBP family glutamic-type intramembrane protease [Phycisphaerae bacterium]
MAWCFLLVNLLVILLASRLRFAGRGLEYASPICLSPQAWWWVIGACAALAAIAAAVGRRRLRDRRARRALLELAVVFPPFFAFEWGMLPPLQRRWFDWAIMAGFVLLIALLVLAERRSLAERGLTGRNFVPAARALAVPTAIMVAAPIAAAFVVGTDFEPGRMARQALTYPAYALLQLLAFQVFLVWRLRRLSGWAATVAVSAGMFALMHWPNGIVMAACAAGAAVWTVVYLRRPNVYALALSMALAVTSFANALPRERVLKNLRTGPIYIERMLEREHG